MNSVFRLGVLAAVLSLWLAVPVRAQYMYIDSNGNGVHDASDRLNSNGVPTCVDIYLNTSQNRNGSGAYCHDPEGGQLDFSGYIVNLLAVNGTVTYGSAADTPPGFTNQQPTLTTAIGMFNPDGTRYSNGFYQEAVVLPGGLYKLCSITITGQTGTPRVDIRPLVLGGSWPTSFFSSSCPGLDYDNVIKYGLDWTDADGLAAGNGIDSPRGITGRVTGDCPGPGTPLLGVDVCARAVGTTSPVSCATTNANGEYSISTLAPGDYEVWVVEPLGYAQEPMVTSPVFCNDVAIVDFNLDCKPLAGTRQKYSWWRYQFDLALGYVGGSAATSCTNPAGRAVYCADTLSAFLDRIYDHFYGNSVNQVDVYGLDPNQVPPPSSEQKLHYVADELLNTGGSEARKHRANRELMVLLLNVVSGRLRTSDLISLDTPGRTVSQAITYFDKVIATPPTTPCGCYSWGAGVVDGGYGCAEQFAQQINNGTTICAGVIPASTLNIAYRRSSQDLRFRAVPNPGTGAWTFSFALAQAGQVRLALFDVAGRHIATVQDRLLDTGLHTISWNGRGTGGAQLARAIYLAQLRTPLGAQTLKMAITGR